MVRRPALLTFFAGLVACTSPQPTEPFLYSNILMDVEFDDESAGVQLLAATPFGVDPRITQLEAVRAYLSLISGCPSGKQPLLLEASGTRVGSSGRGSVRAQLATPIPSEADLCLGEGRVAIVPGSSDTPALSRFRGPIVLEGPSFAARVDLSGILRLDDGFLPFDDWVEISGRIEDDAIRGADAMGRWAPSALHRREVEPGVTALDDFVRRGVHETDVDIDGDGLKRFEYRDGVLVCIDGPETPGGAVLVEGPECPFDPRFVDTFTLRMVLRTMAVHVVE